MKIGLVSEFYYPWPGGISEHLYNLAGELRGRGHEVRVLTGRFDSCLSRLQARVPGLSVGTSHLDGVAPDERHVIRFGRSVAFPYNGGVTAITLCAGLRRQLTGVLRREDFDVLHVHDPLAPMLPLLTVRLARCPVVGTFHAYHQGDNRLLRLFRRPLRGQMERLSERVTVSLSAREAFRRYFDGLSYRVVPNGVQVERFHPNGRTLDRRLSPRKRNILFVGQFVKKKGFGVLLEAFGILSEQRRDVRLIAVGDGPHEAAYRRTTLDVHFLGHRRGKALAGCYEVADVFVAPSIGWESFGIILLEAMAAGVPIVASDIPGFRNVVSAGREALLVPPGDPVRLARAIQDVLDEPGLARALSAAGSRAVRAYSWQRVTDEIETVYRQALGVGEPALSAGPAGG
jgi:phosphatidylinositol alpha-mannosyltransferase